MAVAVKKLRNSPFQDYVQEVSRKFKTGKSTEHTFRGALGELVEAIGHGQGVNAINEPKRVKCGAPDFIVSKKRVPVGYIETKDLGESLDKVEKSEQIQRYLKGLSNLVLTNYLEFRWYVNGQVRLNIKIGEIKTGKLSFDLSAIPEVVNLLSSFFDADVPVIKSSYELAERLAGTTKSICILIKDVYDNEPRNGWLHRWLKAFSEVLISDLDKDTFADMFAQTLAYGFFAARVHQTESSLFSRFSAAKVLPKTNPFLRQLFAEFAGVNMPDEISWAIDEIVELLKLADMNSIMKDFVEELGKNDPVVHFYETFLTAYDPKLREKRGVYYTPDPVVEYVTNSVDEILIQQFGRKKGLADDKTLILDPAVGTASFLHKVVDKIHSKFKKNAGEWDNYISDVLLERIFGFEILMAPYAVAHLKLGLQLQNTGYKFSKNQRLGVFLTNTLEESAKKSQEMLFDWISHEANAASAVKRDKPIMVVLGNPPYSGKSANNGEWINGLLRGYDSLTETQTSNYFQCEGKPLGEKNPKWLNDDYVKFIRFAQWRIQQTGHGVLAFITNHGFLDNPTFRGMRESLINDFDDIYILDLHGNAKKRESSPDGSKDENVFDIQQGVSISFFIKGLSKKESKANVHRADLYGNRDTKYNWLQKNSFSTTEWKTIEPQSPYYLFSEQNNDLWSIYSEGWKVTDIFPVNSVGITTARDSLTIHFTADEVMKTIKDFCSLSVEEAREKFSLGKDARDWKVEFAQQDLRNHKQAKSYVKKIFYRPFDVRFTFYTGVSRGFLCMPRNEVMSNMLNEDCLGIHLCRQVISDNWAHILATKGITEDCYVSNKTRERGYTFPLYINESNDGLLNGKRPNISSMLIEQLSSLLDMTFVENGQGNLEESFGPEDIMGYVYAVLHSELFRRLYNEQLKIDFPRIPFISDKDLFKKLSSLGLSLMKIHSEHSNEEIEDISFPVRGENLVDKIVYNISLNRLNINEFQYFEGVKEEHFNFQIGGYRPLEKWLKDRKGYLLDYSDIKHFKSIVNTLDMSITLIKKIDTVVNMSGGWRVLVSKKASSSEIAQVREVVMKASKNIKSTKKKVS